MPITNLGAQNNLSDLQLPTSYSKPSIATFSDFEYIRTVVLNIPKATVETPTAQGTMLAIFNNATVGIKQANCRFNCSGIFSNTNSNNIWLFSFTYY